MNNLPTDLRTSDLDEFRETVAGLFCPFSLTPRAKKYDARLRHRQLGALSFTHISYDNPIGIDVPPLLPVFMVQVTLRGSFQVRTTGAPHLISGERAHLAPPRVPLKMNCAGATDFLVVSIDPSEFAKVCPPGGEDDRFLLALPDTLKLSGPGASLAHCIRFLHTEAFRPDSLLGKQQVSRHANQMFYSLLLNFREGNSQPVSSGRAWYIKHAEEFMEANLGSDIGIADIVASASISMRALHYGFLKTHGVSPMVWLKQRRLDRVRVELLAANPVETTVTDVALRWGLVHLGRFAADYRARFGELPSTTLYRR